jgi:hypothetical protein
MKYCIEVYQGDRLINIEGDYARNTKKEAQILLDKRIKEQIEDNQHLIDLHADELKTSLMDLDYDDNLPNLAPYQYNYTFKIGKYTNKEARQWS